MPNQHGFETLREGDSLAALSAVPAGRGVYGLLVRNGRQLVEAIGYREFGGEPLHDESDGFALLYIGASGEVRSRVKEHLAGEARISTFRKTLLAAEQFAGAISASGTPLPTAANEEYALDAWLATNTKVAVLPCEDYGARERVLLARMPSPLNIEHRKATPFARRLMMLRALFDGRPVSRAWLPA